MEGTFRAKHGLSGSPATGLKAAAAAIVWDLQEGDWRIEVLNNYATICKEQQLESLYFRKLPLWTVDGRIHPQFRNCGTATRRPTGANPNLMQVAKSMRGMFPAGEGRVFVSMDYSAEEILITACTAKDPVMLSAFQQQPRLDVHSLTASGIAPTLLPRLGIPWKGPMSYEQFVEGLHSPDEKTKACYKQIRNRYAKACNFGVIYGSSAVGLAENMMIDKKEAEMVFNAFMSLYKRVPEWQQEVSAFAREHGYVLMPFGTRRHAEPDLWSDERKLSGRQERQLQNSCIQSAGAEVLKVVRQRMFDLNFRERFDLESTMGIYDEIAGTTPIGKAKDYILALADVMRIQAPGFEVPLDVEASVGFTWGTQIEIGLPTPENIDQALAELAEQLA